MTLRNGNAEIAENAESTTELLSAFSALSALSFGGLSRFECAAGGGPARPYLCEEKEVALSIPSSHMKRNTAGLTMCLALGLQGCADSHGIDIVVPVGFAGPFYIVEDREAGRSIERKDGRYEYVVPENRKLFVRTFDPFLQWHKLQVRFANGETLEYAEASLEGIGEGKKAVHGGGISSNSEGRRTMIYFVGSRKDAEEFFSRIGPAR